MKTLLLTCGTLALACGFASAETFTGRLVDQACAQQQQQLPPEQQQQMNPATSCAPTSATTSFAIVSTGKTIKLDADGNRKAADAWKKYNDSADRQRDPNAAANTASATVQGTMKGDEIKVDSIDVH